jgi:hypothetical protein
VKSLQRIVAALMTGLLGCAAAVAAPARIDGVIASASQDAYVVTTARGQQERISIDASTRVSVRTPAAHSILDRGAYVGVTATPQADGTLLASEVHVFPEAQRGVGEGHHPMRGPPGTTMTNAAVKSVAVRARPMSTNAAVAASTEVAGARQLTLAYAGGTQTIIVPDNVPVVTTATADRKALAPGVHVIVSGERGADGAIAAARISVGANGSVPPI